MEAHQDEIASKIHMEEDMWLDFTLVLRCPPMVTKKSRTHQTNCWRYHTFKNRLEWPFLRSRLLIRAV